MVTLRALFLAAAMVMTTLACGYPPPQELPVTVTPDPESGRLVWADPEGPLTGEIVWIRRTDVLGPDTYLVAETEGGDQCAERVSFTITAGDVTLYDVVLSSDLAGRVKWSVTYGDGKEVRLLSCPPRPTDDPQACLKGGIPRPLFGKLDGTFQAELQGGGAPVAAGGVRFERNPPACGA